MLQLFIQESKKVNQNKVKKQFDYPTNKIESSKNPAFKYERRIYQHVEDFCNRGNRIEKNHEYSVQNVFRKKGTKGKSQNLNKKKEDFQKTQKLSRSP